MAENESERPAPMSFEQSKSELKTKYAEAGIQISDEHAESLYFNFDGEVVPVLKEEIEAYAANRDALADVAAAPAECSLCGDSVREQLVRPLDPLGGHQRYWTSDREYLFRGAESSLPVVRIGPATDSFVDFFRFDPNYLQLCRERMFRPLLVRGRKERVTLRDYLVRPVTIRVTNFSEATVTAAVEKSNAIIETCLFAMSYMRNRPIRLVEEWPTERRAVRSRPFSVIDRHPGFELPLPAVRYNDEIVRFYQLGISTEIPELQFLAFYQVLEYFFVAVSDEALYGRLRTRLADPAFTPAPKHLDNLIKDVTSHSQETNENEMLKLVLQKYVDESELTDFIRRYEAFLDDKYYTKKRDRFAVETEVKLQPGHVFGNVATVVKAVRNALVHSSDRFQRVGRHVPFTKSSELVVKEVPLMKFLAERVILATATPAA
jgi:hypothetical protein